MQVAPSNILGWGSGHAVAPSNILGWGNCFAVALTDLSMINLQTIVDIAAR
jgi:hypothetical protein